MQRPSVLLAALLPILLLAGCLGPLDELADPPASDPPTPDPRDPRPDERPTPPPDDDPSAGVLGPERGALDLAFGVRLSVGVDALAGQVSFTVREVGSPAPLPVGAVLNGPFVEITPSAPELVDGAVQVSMGYDDPPGRDQSVGLLHWDPAFSRWDLLPIVHVDGAERRVAGVTRTFSPVAPVLLEGPAPTAFDTGFRPEIDGFAIPNPDHAGGNCQGVSAFAAFFYDAHPDLSLHAWSEANPEIAAELAIRTQAAQHHFTRTWSEVAPRADSPSGPLADPRRVLDLLGRPYVLGLVGHGRDGSTIGHAVVLYGYADDVLKVYDPNGPGLDLEIRLVDVARRAIDYPAYSGTGSVYDQFDIKTPLDAVLGSRTALEQLWQRALAGFPGPTVDITSHEDAVSVNTGREPIAGVATGADYVYLLVDDRYLARAPVEAGTFALTAPIFAHDTLVTVGVFACPGDAEPGAWFLDCAHDAVLLEPWMFGGLVSDLRVALDYATAQGPSTEVVFDLYLVDPRGELVWEDNPTPGSGGRLSGDGTRGTMATFETDEPPGGLYQVQAGLRYFWLPGSTIPERGLSFATEVVVEVDGATTTLWHRDDGPFRPATSTEPKPPGHHAITHLAWLDTRTGEVLDALNAEERGSWR